MGRKTVGVIAVLSALLPCAATSHAAGDLGNATMVVISADPDQIDGGGSPDCSAINPCTYPREDGAFGPAIHFVMSGPGSIDISADIWGTAFDCSGDPDTSVGTSMDLPGGPYIVYIIFRPPPLPGDTFAITWNLGDCPSPAVFCAIYWTPYTLDMADPAACVL